MYGDDPLLEEEGYERRPQHKPHSWFFTHRRIVMIASVVGLASMALITTAIIMVAIHPDKSNGSNNNDHNTNHNEIDRLPVGLYKIADTDCYVVGDTDDIIFIMPDIYGMSEDVKKIANFYANGGFTTVVVDYFNGDPRTNRSDPSWNIRHPANLSLALANGVIGDTIKRGYRNFQVQGYCYGGRIGVSLTFKNKAFQLRAAVVAHPSSLVSSDADLIDVPISFVMPEVDTFNSLAPYFNQTLTARHIPSLFKIYPNTTHGFAASSTQNPVQQKIAMQDSLKWFKQHQN